MWNLLKISNVFINVIVQSVIGTTLSLINYQLNQIYFLLKSVEYLLLVA